MHVLLAYWAIPFLTLLVALIPLLPQVFQNHARAKTAVLAVVLASLFVLQAAHSQDDAIAHDADQARLQKQLDYANRAADALEKSVDTMKADVKSQFNAVIAMLRQSGLSTKAIAQGDLTTIERSLRATQLARRAVPNGRPSTQSSSIEITYFPKKVDGQVVRTNLSRLGYRFVLGEPVLKDLPTNSIWAGDGVPIADVRAIGLTLMRAGVQFQLITRFCQPGGVKAKTVQIGTSGDAVDDHLALKTPAQVASLTALEPNPYCA